MQLIDGTVLVFSATDLVGYLACEHLTELEKAAAAGLTKRPMRADPELDLIRKRGFEHEQRFLAELEASGRKVTRIELDASESDRLTQLRAAAEETEAAIRRGDDVIYQATFFDGRWRGHADFLLRVDDPSDVGAWSYEVADTKLAHHTKASALLQICSYVDQLTRIQGRQPEWMHVALGGAERRIETFRVADFMAYYRMAKAEFETATAAPATFPSLTTYPDPVEHCDVCRWAAECAARRRADDDLSLVAGITGRQRRVLKANGAPTRRQLAALPVPLQPPFDRLDGVGPASLERTREQARVQVEGEDLHRPVHELIPPARTRDGALIPNLGLLSLPVARPGDLFFDIEGDPFAGDDGIDYLFGVLEPGLSDAADPSQPTFHAIWARDDHGQVTPAAEKAAFERVIDLFIERLDADPTMHIYHYAAYEPTALGRLMGRHATREAQVDRLLRGKVLVDLYRAVRQGVRASVESYSIKKLETFYGFEREVDLRDAGSSIVAFESWLEVGGEDGHDDQTLERIERYNRDDVVSTLLLRRWLESLRPDLANLIGEEPPRPQPRSGEASETLTEAQAEIQAVVERLTADVPVDALQRTDEQHARWLLAQLLGWHRREDKSAWWRFFHLMSELTDDERLLERDAIAGLVYEGPVGTDRQSTVYRFRFPPQEHSIDVGTDVRDPGTATPDDQDGSSPGTIVRVDNVAGVLELKRATRSGPPAPIPTSLVPLTVYQTTTQRDSLLRIGTWVAENGIDPEGEAQRATEPSAEAPLTIWDAPSILAAASAAHKSARDLLLRRPPSVRRDGQREDLKLPDEHPRDAARRLIHELDSSYLAIQGPPGSGKTTVGAEMIVDLVEDGHRIGVTANSHKVIGLLLTKVAEAAEARGVPVRIGQKPANGDDPTCEHARCYGGNAELRAALDSGEIDVAGGTGWVWSRADFEGSVDVLFVDEAGQVSLANALAVSPAARSLVLLGDPQQLDQPLQGSHPPGAERSALAHLLDGGPRRSEPRRTTMPDALGLFLDGTWRLHPDICAFTSDVFYEGRLVPEPGRDLQRVAGAEALDGAGIRWLPVAHDGNRNESPEEAEALRALIAELLAATPSWMDPDGLVRPVTLRDVLVITPYNAQVRAIATTILGARVGTVDKFQGQEAAISIYSMATSSAEEAPRGMEFLYSLNRLNVATSRARCVAAVLASPELVRVRCRTPRQMQLANGLARLVEMSADGKRRPS